MQTMPSGNVSFSYSGRSARLFMWCGAVAGVLIMVATTSGQGPTMLGVQLYPALSITGAVGSVQTIQYATTLAGSNSWQCLAIVQLTYTQSLYFDTTAVAVQRRYYRAAAGPSNLV